MLIFLFRGFFLKEQIFSQNSIGNNWERENRYLLQFVSFLVPLPIHSPFPFLFNPVFS